MTSSYTTTRSSNVLNLQMANSTRSYSIRYTYMCKCGLYERVSAAVQAFGHLFARHVCVCICECRGRFVSSSLSLSLSHSYIYAREFLFARVWMLVNLFARACVCVSVCNTAQARCHQCRRRGYWKTILTHAASLIRFLYDCSMSAGVCCVNVWWIFFSMDITFESNI